jgi:hypothetical protein
MPAAQAAALIEFARSAKGAARAVSLYPATHPAIQAALGRIVSASAKLTLGGDATLVVLPQGIVIDGRSPARPDAVIGELAELLHARLVGTLGIDRGADAKDWLALLALLAMSPEELIAQGGMAKAWALTGRSHFEVREIDYAEVLRERSGGDAATWDRIVVNCLQGDSFDLDERTISALLEIAGDVTKFGDFLQRLQDHPAGSTKVGERAAALLLIVRGLVSTLSARAPERVEQLLQNLADATSRLSPEMMLALLLASGNEQATDLAEVAGSIFSRMSDRAIAGFVAQNVVAERGATARLAQAFGTLAPGADHRERLLGVAHAEVAQSALGAEPGFDALWLNVAGLLMSYSDKQYVSVAYASELTAARPREIGVERVSDDPPERIQGWIATVSEGALRELDLHLLLDLLRLEREEAVWRETADVVIGEIERLTALGKARGAQQLLEAVVREIGPDGRDAFRPAATQAVHRLAAGPLVRNVILHLRKADEADVLPLNTLCHTLGPIMVKPLAESLAAEDNNRAVRRLRELLLGFGAAGRQSVEQLKNAPNPAVRRTAVDLLRVFGGHEALPELASMLDDADPQVQRESIRAIVQIGTEKAYAVLERALVSDSSSRETILQQLIALRDEKAIPLMSYVLDHTTARGRLLHVHLAIIDALAGLSGGGTSTETLKRVLYRREWWAPFRTAALRHAAALALRRIGSPDTVAVLEEAVAIGPRGVRRVARAQMSGSARSRGEVEA